MTLCKCIMQDNQPLHTHTVIGIHQSRNTTKNSLMYIYEIAEKTPQQQLEGQPSVSSSKPNYNRTSIHESSHNLMRCPLTKCVGPSPLSWIAVMSCHDIRLTFSSAPNGGCREVYVIFPILWPNNYRNICVHSLCYISRSKTQSWCWLALLDHTKTFIQSSSSNYIIWLADFWPWGVYMVELAVCRQGIPKRQERLIILNSMKDLWLLWPNCWRHQCGCPFQHQKLEGRSNQKHNPISLDL
jgi:hypothetical protein